MKRNVHVLIAETCKTKLRQSFSVRFFIQLLFPFKLFCRNATKPLLASSCCAFSCFQLLCISGSLIILDLSMENRSCWVWAAITSCQSCVFFSQPLWFESETCGECNFRIHRCLLFTGLPEVAIQLKFALRCVQLDVHFKTDLRDVAGSVLNTIRSAMLESFEIRRMSYACLWLLLALNALTQFHPLFSP